MKRILIIAICFFGLGLPFASSVSNSSNVGSGIYAPTTSDGWEFIGEVPAYYTYGGSINCWHSSQVNVFAKGIGNQIFYRAQLKGESSVYKVYLGSWSVDCSSCKGKKHGFNARFEESNTRYWYLDL